MLCFGVATACSSGQITAGALVVYVLYLGKMYKPIKDLSKTRRHLLEGRGRLRADRRDAVGRTPGQRSSRRARGGARSRDASRFDRVTFGYGAARAVLNDVDLPVEPRPARGAGRPDRQRQVDADRADPAALRRRSAARCRIDGDDVRSYTLQSLREQVSFVLQDPVLFRATMPRTSPTAGRTRRRADIRARERGWPMPTSSSRACRSGYDTVIGERGDTLSGGQRQRIAIARAIIRDTPILLLDEPSAALDPESEELIFDGLARLLEGRTSITIAHRLATVRSADVIFVLDGGSIVETGTHDELLARNGQYARFHRIQFRMGEARKAV